MSGASANTSQTQTIQTGLSRHHKLDFDLWSGEIAI